MSDPHPRSCGLRMISAGAPKIGGATEFNQVQKHSGTPQTRGRATEAACRACIGGDGFWDAAFPGGGRCCHPELGRACFAGRVTPWKWGVKCPLQAG